VHAVMEQEAAADPAYALVPQELRDFLRTRFLASSLPGLLGMADALRSEPDRVAKLHETRVPVLVAFGVADDAWYPAVQRDMATRLGAQVAVIDRAAHSPAVENTAGTLAALRPFWAAHR
jgi:pimeloyl-ACP methyl ester carboxylesterase